MTCMLMCRLLILTSVVCFGFVKAGKDPKCILDESKPASYPGNYMDCARSSYFSSETTCCDVKGTKICCSVAQRWSKVKFIAIGIGCTTVALGMLLFTILWCNVESKPCGQSRRTLFRNCCCRRDERRPVSRNLRGIPPGGIDVQYEGRQMMMMNLPVIKVETCPEVCDNG